MAKDSLDGSIDELYQLPLDEFTAARNALAKDSGDGGVKRLEKPNVAAWAVNQLYWRERKLYDEVLKTAEQVRTAFKQKLAGKSADVRAVEVFRNEAMRKAKDAIRRLLAEAGSNAADAIMTPVTETLDALPSAEAPGRLTKPLRRTGFEVLQGVPIAAKPATPPGHQAARSSGRQEQSEKETEKDRRKREADLEGRAMARERLRFAEAAEREAEASVDRARRTLDRAERTRERVERELDEAGAAEKSARKELASSESAYARAQAERDRLAKKAAG